ncbi:MAG: hypothetical protein HYS32_02870 [Candidatus Woesearchaeota archaeon]|nr:MAG: hypothetical protein HYS32_02870 [Candidatus Woesearchaeota archaeon]
MILSIIISIIVSFIATFLIVPKTIGYLRRIGIVVKDVHKSPVNKIPISGGLAVMSGLFLGLMTYIFIQTFFSANPGQLIWLLAAMTSILIITLVGFVDDLLVRFDKKEQMYLGLKRWQKPLLVLPAAIPLIAVKAGVSEIFVPLIGVVNLAYLYPLILVPIGLVGAANMVNLLEGLNGLGTGMGIIYTFSLGIFAYVNKVPEAAALSLITCGALIAFFWFNKVPARILPGDSLTYLLGAVIACVAIIGNVEKAALIISIPFFIEFFLKLRGRFKKETIGYVKKDKLYSKYKKVYSIPHIFMRTGKFTEKQIVWYIILIESVFALAIWFI